MISLYSIREDVGEVLRERLVIYETLVLMGQEVSNHYS